MAVRVGGLYLGKGNDFKSTTSDVVGHLGTIRD